MNVRQVCLVAIVASFFIGYGQSESRLQSADPNPCSKWECKTVHAVWYANRPTVQVRRKVGLTDNHNSARPDIFATTSTEKLPTAAGGNMDLWSFAACNPTCGKDVAGNWQADQEVAPAGVGTIYEDNPWPRSVCTAAEGGNGVLATSQSNSNTSKPPGFDAEPIAP